MPAEDFHITDKDYSAMPTIVMVRTCEMRKTRNNDNFLSFRVNLGREGNFAEIDAKMWGADSLLSRGIAVPACGDLIAVDYQTEEYQGRAQWKISGFKPLSDGERRQAMPQFTPEEKIDRLFYRQRLDDLIDQTSTERAPGQLLREIFDQAGFRERFYLSPAARDHHQNYPGGLLEHTLNVVTVALAMADAYARPGSPAAGLTFNQARLPLDRDILIAAGLLHDIGKLDTYKFDPMPEVTDAQMWTGHLVVSYAVVRERAAEWLANPPYPAAADEVNKILHCILSHHGTLEYGSPVVPACAEAFILSQADMTDARLAELAEAGLAAREKDPQARWLRRQMHFPGGIFVGDWS